MKKKSLIILITILILLGFVFGFIYWFQYIRPTVPVPKPVSAPESVPASVLCAKFPEIQGEITCQEAVAVALEKYPGTVQQINKTQTSVPIGSPPNVTLVQQEVWIVGVSLEEPIKDPFGEMSKINVIVSLKEKKILNVMGTSI